MTIIKQKHSLMDTVIVKKKNRTQTIILISILVGLLSVGIYTMLTKQRTLIVKPSEISIKTVANDYFEDFIILQSKVEPLQSMLVNIIEGGAVQEIYTENGNMVTQGQPLARLYNPNTELNYLTQETAIIEQINNLNKAKLDLRNQELNLDKDLISIEHDFADAKQLYDLNQKLFDKGIIARMEWDKTQENFRFQQERMRIIKQSIAKEKQANQIQISQLNQSIATMQKSLNILRNNKKNFLITAPVSGRLSSFEPILGKTYNQGESIGKIDVMQGYKLIANVDEFYLDKVAIGQKGEIEYSEKIYTVTVSKVIPEVKNGQFSVELTFNQPLQGLRQGLSFGIRLLLSEKVKTKVLPKGSFYTDTSGEWVFVVKGSTAQRKDVKLGRENPYYYEVLEGLSVGDKVVTSSYKDYKNVAVLKLENQ